MSPQIPLRTALIGLSSTATTSWAANAHLPALLTSAGRSKFTITALLNSSVDAAQSAIKTYELPKSTKAYGTPDDLANDPDIDLVICNTRVDKHYSTILPSVKAGKAVYVEWPIAANLQHADELVEAAEKSGARVAVGLQRRWLPPLVKIRSIIAEGRLGKVLSADVRAFGGIMGRDTLPEGLRYFADRKIGGNPIVIGVGHSLDFVLSVLGDFEPGSVHSKMQLQRPDFRVKNKQTGEIVGSVKSDVPDLLSVHGALAGSENLVKDATLTYLFRVGPPFKATPAFTFAINLEHGEILLTSPSGPALEAAAQESPVTIKIHHFDTDEVEDVAWDWNDEQKELPPMATGVQSCLYAFADAVAEGKNKVGLEGGLKEGWVGLKDARERARLIESFLAGWEKESK